MTVHRQPRPFSSSNGARRGPRGAAGGRAVRGLAAAVLALCAATVAVAADWRYAVRPGDTLIDIAAAYMARPQDWPQLQALNEVADPRRLVPGTRLRIPLAWLRQGAAVATVIHVRGDARRIAGEHSTPVQPGDSVAAGDTLVTAAHGSLSLRFVDGSRLLLTPDTRLTLARLRQYGRTGMAETTIRLHRGDVDSQVAPQRAPGASYRIESPVLNLGVRGTRFRVGVAADGRTRGEVLSGRVHAGGEAAAARGLDLGAGFGAVAGPGELAAAPLALAPAPSLDGLAGRIERLPLRFAWAAQEGAAAWRAQVLADEGEDRLLLDGRFDEPVARWADLPDGAYRLRVRAIAGNGLEGYDGEHRFVVAARPEAPLALAPSAGQWVRATPTVLRWAQPLAAARYRLQVADDAGFAAPLADLELGATEHALTLPPGDYFWRVASITAEGRQGPFGEAQRFGQRLAPASPGLDEPSVEDDALVFRWQAGDAGQQVQLQLARDPAFAELIVDVRQREPAYRLPLADGGRVFLRLRTIDHDGFAGPWGQPQAITVPAATPLWPLLLPLLLLL